MNQKWQTSPHPIPSHFSAPTLHQSPEGTTQVFTL